ncbi:hypothetical protein AAFF_G00193280 [Aldrovandia affinis]|uniref:Uncharacterized protein n=1 Tax=Aldrovandia affinis TaxID=143900 RepID=A0AAD7R042_9TELE|nr:hypothetical protein AAFF_G00193280 [Aldrovandia affinis]
MAKRDGEANTSDSRPSTDVKRVAILVAVGILFGIILLGIILLGIVVILIFIVVRNCRGKSKTSLWANQRWVLLR